MATIESAKACGRTTDDLPCAWKLGHLLLHDPAPEGDGTPLATRASGDCGLIYGKWPKMRLVLLPKKGHLPLAKNWRGTCLLDTGSKIPFSIMAKRMQAFLEQVVFEMRGSGRSAGRSTGSSR